MREEQLRYVLEIAHTGSINKAADSLFISHQSLERSLKNFENDLGIKIFKRSKKGVEVTELGKVALEKIQELASGFDDLRAIGKDYANMPCVFEREFTIYVASYIKYPLINIAMQRLISVFPDIKFRARTCRNIENVQDNEFYFLITANEERLKQIDRDKYYYQEFFEDKTYLVVSVNHPLAKYKEVSIHKTLQYPFVAMQMEDAMPNPIQIWCNDNGYHMAVGLETDHLATYIQAIRGGNVIGCWPEIALTMNELNIHKDIKIISVKDLPYFRVYGLMNRESFEDNEDIMQVLLQVIRQNIKK